ncbi:hypothetical protein SAY87_001690 [Trapa incisa]|uniref:TORTIFOLIA1/SINE1-2 N-terminal domain-containing protein n=1 Tax=Trapa incisa TaxID=236973 RepID=A0AAN7PTH7_9MYRT|nr:hypothetical protein SAY87_001690 [Trapa incisa]
MSPPRKINSPSIQLQDLKSRVISSLNKLSDRDTVAVAVSELQSIVQSLTPDTFSAFLSCIHSTDDSSKSAVRRQCVHILALLSQSHGEDLSPHVSKMAAIIVRRLRDPDSSVRAACVAAVSAIAANIPRSPFSAILKPLTDALATEQGANSQIGAAMCIAAAVDATAAGMEAEQLRRLLPKAGKLLKSEGFKAKAAVLGMVGSLIGVGGVVSEGILEWLIPLVMGFLNSDDWAARKAAAEALGRVADEERELASEHRASCLKCLEARRFDKVKIVRETMNRSLELWKEIAYSSDEISASSHSSSSSPGNGVAGCFPSLSRSPRDISRKSGELKKPVPTIRSSPCAAPGTIIKVEGHQKTTIKTPNSSISSRSEQENCSFVEPHSLKSASEHDDAKTHYGVPQSDENGSKGSCRPETKQSFFGKIADNKMHKSGSRIVPLSDPEKYELEPCVSGIETSTEDYDNEKEMQNLSMVHKQLAQIEKQQSSLFELLQKFIGSSQNGMNSLETRVQGLEIALEEISYDLGLPGGRFPNGDYSGNTCCKLPGADFLSSKFWRKAEGQYSISRLSSLGSVQAGIESFQLSGERFQNQNTGAFAKKSEIGVYSNKRSQLVLRDIGASQFINSNRPEGTSPVASFAAGSFTNRHFSFGSLFERLLLVLISFPAILLWTLSIDCSFHWFVHLTFSPFSFFAPQILCVGFWMEFCMWR